MIMHAVKIAFPGTPVIIITAYGSPDLSVDWWLEQGASAYLEKPIDSGRLLETVERVLSAVPGTV
jgi:DNA-binding NtrC family response regulator